MSPSAATRTTARAADRSPRSAPRETAAGIPADYLQLCVLADRAELWATIAPGLGHHLANALMSLSLPSGGEATRHSAQSRVERAHRVLHNMCEPEAAALPQSLHQVLEDVDTWHRLQMGLPACRLSVRLEAGIPATTDARLHHALLAILTLERETGACQLALSARGDQDFVAIEIESELRAGTDSKESASVSRRRRVIAHLMTALGGHAEEVRDGAARRWVLRLPLALAKRAAKDQIMLSNSCIMSSATRTSRAAAE